MRRVGIRQSKGQGGLMASVRRVLARATRHMQPDYFNSVGAGRGGLKGDLAIRSSTQFLLVSGVGVTGTVQACHSRLMLLLGAVVGAVVGAGVGMGPRLAVARSGTLESFRRSRKR